MQFPITQVEIGKVTGMSNAHVNRVLETLRSKNLIILKGDRLKVLDWAGLQESGDFDPGFPHLGVHAVPIRRAALH